jgi:DNA-binding MarR family transcriptional regulator
VRSQVSIERATAPALDAWFRLLTSHAAARRSLEVELQQAHGLTATDYEALQLLACADEGSLRRVDLAHALARTASGVTRLLEGLERDGLVVKHACARDARVTYAVITAAGREKLAEASCSHVRAVRALFEERFSDDELMSLAELLGRLP